jgi:peptide deformylase
MKHSDYVTHINNKEDEVYLRSKLLPVNMRLFKTSPEYKNIILNQCSYMKKLVLTKMDGYKKPHGMSSANAGLAFNIIAICRYRGTNKEHAEIMINPVIVDSSKTLIAALSNCGSITLAEPITIKRPEWIKVEWYDEKGVWNSKIFTRETNAFTIAHEIDHNNGVLITDY